MSETNKTILLNRVSELISGQGMLAIHAFMIRKFKTKVFSKLDMPELRELIRALEAGEIK